MRIRKFNSLVRKLTKIFRNRREIFSLANVNCRQQPAQSRKNRLRRYLDLCYAAVKWNEVSPLYYAQQMDLKGSRISKDFLPYSRFAMLRDRRNCRYPNGNQLSYGSLLQDKLVFERYFSLSGLPVAVSRGVVDEGNVARLSGLPEKDFFALGVECLVGQALFLKPRFGIKGKGVFKLVFDNQSIWINGYSAERSDLESRTTVECLVQNEIDQHPVVARFHPSSLNTLRIITVRDAGTIRIFLMYLRMACGGEVADNNPNHRIVVRVDDRTGDLYKEGIEIGRGDFPEVCRKHPDSGVNFDEVTIPFFDQCREVAEKAHAWVPGLVTVGWDVAITPDGPLLIEGNDNWGATLAMWVMPDFVKRFLEL